MPFSTAQLQGLNTVAKNHKALMQIPAPLPRNYLFRERFHYGDSITPFEFVI